MKTGTGLFALKERNSDGYVSDSEGQ